MLRTVIACLGVLLLAGCGVTGNFRQDPGYAKFDGLTALRGHREIGLSFGPLPLALARLVIDDEPEVDALLGDLRAVRVYVYDSLDDTERVERQVSAVRNGLLDEGWASIATVRDGDDRVSVMLRLADGGTKTRGLTVIVQDASELVLVNLIGNVRIDRFAKYMAALDVDVPAIDFAPNALRAAIPH